MRRSGGSRPRSRRIGRESQGSLRVSGGQLAFVETAQHHALEGLQARFQRAEDAHAHVARFRPPHRAIGDGRVEDFGVVAAGDAEAFGGRAFDEVGEGAFEHAAVVAGEDLGAA